MKRYDQRILTVALAPSYLLMLALCLSDLHALLPAFGEEMERQNNLGGGEDVHGELESGDVTERAVGSFLSPLTAPLTRKPPPTAAITNVPSCPTPQTTVTVTTARELRDILASDFTGTIVIPSGATIELVHPETTNPGSLPTPVHQPMRYVQVKSCVHIKGTRGGLDPGALLFTNQKDPGAVFQVNGHDISIEGLRFQGPVPTYTDSLRESDAKVDAIAVAEEVGKHVGVNIIITNNDFWFWTSAITIGCEDCQHNAPDMKKDQAGFISVTRNYFHRNAREGAGYGVVIGSGYVLIEGNLFTHNRHAVAHGGYGKSGYVARYNYVLEGGFTEGSIGYWNQHFDVHGQGPKGYGAEAGEYIEIAHNTIRGEQTYFAGMQTRPAFMLRGKPTDAAHFHDNVVVHNDASKAVRLKVSVNCDQYGNCESFCRSHAECNLHVGQNTYNTDTTAELAVGDFDGDGRDDVFLANGTGWWYSSAGYAEWRFLQPSTLRIKALRFGRFNKGTTTDVLFRDGANWWVSLRGSALRQWVRADSTLLEDCVFGDFDGDGITDALRANGATWAVARGVVGPWEIVQHSNARAADLRVGDFNEDGKDDVFLIQHNVPGFPPTAKFWSYWQWGRPAPDRLLPALSPDIASLVVADFDGDGRADIAETDGNGWRWSRGASTGWMRLRESGDQNHYRDIRSVLIGRFLERDRKVEAIRYELLPRVVNEFGDTTYDRIGQRFMIWRGHGTPHAFTPWTPELQEMR